MLNNKKFDIVLSIVIAIGLWAYVIGETNPIDSKTFRGIPISFIHEESLNESNLAVLDESDSTVDITVTGTRAKLSEVKEEDVRATVDLSEAALGKNELGIRVQTPDHVELEEKSINKVTVNIERKARKSVNIIAGYDGDFKENKEPLIIEMGRESVNISGAESRVNRVKNVKAVIPASEIGDEMKTITCTLIPVDSSGKKVRNINLSAGVVKITVSLVGTKAVPLEVPIVDNADGDIIHHTSSPKTITVKGKASELEKIDKIKADPVDVTFIREDSTIPIKITLPDGVEISSQSLSMKVTVTVEKLSEKKFSFSSQELKFTDIPEELKASPEDGSIEVTVKGKEKELAEIAKEDISLSISLDGQKAGSYSMEIKAKCEKANTSIEVEPKQIKVNIELR